MEGRQPWLVVVVTAIVALVPPVTAQVYGNSSKAKEMALAQQRQDQEMRMAFLDRAIDPKYPPESRYQVLRFLKAVSTDTAMKVWAEEELSSVKSTLDLKAQVAKLRQDVAQKEKEAVQRDQEDMSLKGRLDAKVKSPDKSEKLALEARLAEAKKAQKEAETARQQAEARLAKVGSLNSDLSPTDESNNLSALAKTYLRKGDYSEAEITLRRALRAQQEKFGSNHPAVADILCDLATLHLALGKLDEAASEFRMALQIRIRALGDSDSGNARILTGLAAVLEARGNLEEAQLLRRRADEIYRLRDRGRK